MFDLLWWVVPRSLLEKHGADFLLKLEPGDQKRLGGFTLRGNKYSVSVRGSLPKHMYQTNYVELSRAGLRRGLDELSQLLQFDIRLAALKRVEFGANLSLRHSPATYMHCLGRLRNLGRHYFIRDGLETSYRGMRPYIKIYDKGKELKRRQRLDLPGNLLRYEVGLGGVKLGKLFGRPVFGSDLEDPAVIKVFEELWKREFQAIEKLPRVVDPLWEKVSTASQLIYALAATEARARGIPALFDLIDQLRSTGQICRRNANRMKALFTGADKKFTTESTEEVEELEAKILAKDFLSD